MTTVGKRPLSAHSTQHECLDWDVLLDYERAEVIRNLLDVLSYSVFQRDRLGAAVREEMAASSQRDPVSLSSILLCGHAGPARRELVLRLTRDLRLRRVRDMGTSVTFGCVAEDLLPRLMLAPLVPCAHTRAYRQWYRARCAMQTGVLQKLAERSSQIRDRLREMLRTSGDGAGSPATSKGDSGSISSVSHSAAADGSEEVSSHLGAAVPLGQAAAEAQNSTLFEAIAKELRVDLTAIAATVPTVLVAWSHRYPSCEAWLRQHLFNNDAVRLLRETCGGVPEKFAMVFGIDPWMRFVERHAAVKPSRKTAERVRRQRVTPNTVKCAQIVLVSVDRDRAGAEVAFDRLLRLCQGWRSQEVSLLSLWAGEEGLQSDFCDQFGVNSLPFVVVTKPMRRVRATGELTRPRVASTTAPAEGEEETPEMHGLSSGGGGRWCEYPRESRAGLFGRLSRKLAQTDAPVRFSASVEQRHQAAGTGAVCRPTSSGTALRGLISDLELPALRDELAVLAAMSDFSFEVQVVRASGPLHLALNARSPSCILRNIRRAVTCTSCAAAIDIEVSPHYRCVHCGKEEHGTLCEECAAAQRLDQALKPATTASGTRIALHPAWHILLRIPPLSPELIHSASDRAVQTIPLLWGVNNVVPLPLFCGRIIRNLSMQHFGVHCNRCLQVASGVRWKCAVCYEHDLCGRCFEALALQDRQSPSGAASAVVTPSRHASWHPMLCVPHAMDGDANSIIRPYFIEDPLGALGLKSHSRCGGAPS